MSTAHVSLPSNASYRQYPDNTNSDYRVQLERPLVLDAGAWEVGMTDIIYSNSWHNVDEGELSLNYVHRSDDSPSRVDMRIALGRYVSVREVVDALVRTFAQHRVSNVLIVVYDDVTNRVRFSLNHDYALKDNKPFLAVSKDLSEILGFPARTAIFGPTALGSTPDINRGMTSLYVYSDVVSDRLVGDALAPLLRVVPISNARNDTSHVEFSSVHYLPVADHSIEVVRMRVMRDNGDEVRFNGGKVIVNLHFRRIA
jgi:hypothetical protein